MATKPDIQDLEIEYDVRDLDLNDGETVLIWPDASGKGNDAIRAGTTTPNFVKDGWSDGVDAVRLQDQNQNFQERFIFSGFPEWQNTEATFFIVFEATDLTDGVALLGSKSGVSPPNKLHTISVDIDGTIFYNKEFSPRLIDSAPGVIEQGGRYIVTGRMSFVTGMILRVNGVEVGAINNADARQGIGSWPDSSIGQTRNIVAPGGEYGLDKLIVWLSGYTFAASDAEILAMESFLGGIFFIAAPTDWVPCVPDPATAWSDCIPIVLP